MFSNKLATVCAAGVFATIGAAAASASDDAAPSLAQLTGLSGNVLVEQGDAIAPAEAGMELTALDRVLVLEQGKATLSFDNGCLDEVTGPAMRTITAAGTCAEQAAAGSSLSDVAADAVAGQNMLALQQAATSQYGDDDDDRRLGLWILGAGALGGVIWAATVDDDKKRPAQPPAPISP